MHMTNAVSSTRPDSYGYGPAYLNARRAALAASVSAVAAATAIDTGEHPLSALGRPSAPRVVTSSIDAVA
jgi:hypothetical protein